MRNKNNNTGRYGIAQTMPNTPRYKGACVQIRDITLETSWLLALRLCMIP